MSEPSFNSRFSLHGCKDCKVYSDILHFENVQQCTNNVIINEPVHEFSKNVVCTTSKVSDQPAHMRSLIRAFACRLNIL